VEQEREQTAEAGVEPAEVVLTAEDRERIRRQRELGAGCGCIGYVLWTVAVAVAGAIIVLGRVNDLLTASSSLRADLLAGRLTRDEYTRMINDIQSQQVFYIVGWLVVWILGLTLIWLAAGRRRGRLPEDEEDLGY
jgi:hypothetical protein